MLVREPKSTEHGQGTHVGAAPRYQTSTLQIAAALQAPSARAPQWYPSALMNALPRTQCVAQGHQRVAHSRTAMRGWNNFLKWGSFSTLTLKGEPLVIVRSGGNSATGWVSGGDVVQQLAALHGRPRIH